MAKLRSKHKDDPYDIDLLFPPSKIDSYSAAIISKYLDKETTKKLIQVCKKLNKAPEYLHYNPFPLNANTRKLFPNMETQYIYSAKDQVFTDGKIKKYVIEKEGDSIPDGAFKNWNPAITEVTIAPHVHDIEMSAFEGCANLKSIILPPKLEYIGSDAFKDCKKLESITIPSSVRHIYISAFKGCKKLESITTPLSVVYIEESVFEGCTNLKSVKFSPTSKIKNIYEYTFKNCTSLESITIPSSVKNIYDSAFEGCKKLKYIKFSSSVETIFASAFEGCRNGLELIFDKGVNAGLEILGKSNARVFVTHKGDLSDAQKEEFTRAFKTVVFTKI